MIRHIVLFKLHPGVTWQEANTARAVELAQRVGDEVPELVSWYAGRNISDRAVAYDFVVMGTVRDERDLDSYMHNPFHRKAIDHWRQISDWVIADVIDEDAVTVTRGDTSEGARA